VKKRLKQRDPILSIRIKEVLTRRRRSTVEAVLVTRQRVQPADPGCSMSRAGCGFGNVLWRHAIEKVASKFVTALSEEKLIEGPRPASSLHADRGSAAGLLQSAGRIWRNHRQPFSGFAGTVALASERRRTATGVRPPSFSQLPTTCSLIFESSGLYNSCGVEIFLKKSGHLVWLPLH